MNLAFKQRIQIMSKMDLIKDPSIENDIELSDKVLIRAFNFFEYLNSTKEDLINWLRESVEDDISKITVTKELPKQESSNQDAVYVYLTLERIQNTYNFSLVTELPIHENGEYGGSLKAVQNVFCIESRDQKLIGKQHKYLEVADQDIFKNSLSSERFNKLDKKETIDIIDRAETKII